MKLRLACALLALLLPACSTPEYDRSTLALPVAVRTQMTFEPLTRLQAERYIEGETHTFKTSIAPLEERQAGLAVAEVERLRKMLGEAERNE